MNPPSPWIGSMITAATLSSPTCVWIRVLIDVERLGLARLGAARPAQRVGHRHPVDLAGERAEALLVRHVLGGQRHRQVGAAVVGVVERDHRLPPGVVAGDLDRVLDRLGARVEQRGALLVGARRRRASSSQTSTYPSYGVTMKQVWVNCATCCCTRLTTASAALPTDVTAMPEPKSISELPSASSITPPPAAVMKTGSVVEMPRATVRVAALHQGARGGSGDLGDKVTALRQLRAANGERGHDRTITSTDA